MHVKEKSVSTSARSTMGFLNLESVLHVDTGGGRLSCGSSWANESLKLQGTS